MKLDVLIERRNNASDHSLDYQEQAAAITAEIELLDNPPDPAAIEAARLAAEQAEFEEAQRLFEEATAAELERLAGEELVDVGVSKWVMSPGGPYGQRVPSLVTSPYPNTVRRANLETYQAEQQRLADLAAEKETALREAAEACAARNDKWRAAGGGNSNAEQVLAEIVASFERAREHNRSVGGA